MAYINVFIEGAPYKAGKRHRGNISGPAKWTDTVREETKGLPKVKDACLMKVTFLLQPDRFPTDFPLGPDLDNLLKRFLDALNTTIFSEAKGGDSCVVSLFVNKVRVGTEQPQGAHLEIFPMRMV